MKSFDPIAIVGRACLLPGANTPADLWSLVIAGKHALAPASSARWRLTKADLRALGETGEPTVLSDQGGYVTGFDDLLKHHTLSQTVSNLDRLDPLFQWLCYAGAGVLADARIDKPPHCAGLIVGNLSYPSEAHTRFVEQALIQASNDRAPGRSSVDPRNRFSSGMPVHFAARTLGLSGPAFAIDAACSSALYAIKLAADHLHTYETDFMIAGGVNRADDFFLHLGFSALQALSPTGQSRPFHMAADGLIPSEGIALVGLKRLSDAERDGDKIYGVIRSIGLSNDGRKNGFLAPAHSGQVEAIKSAHEQAGLGPQDISYIECHATGTARGDGIELESLETVWNDLPKPIIGSLKANIGHTITASGAASLIKIVSCFDAGLVPPTPFCSNPIEAVSRFGFQLPQEATPWPSGAPLRAGISNFGFGGNNAHMVVEAYENRSSKRTVTRQCLAGEPEPKDDKDDIVVVSIGIMAGSANNLEAFQDALRRPRPEQIDPIRSIDLDIASLNFPPNDLKASLAQQTALLRVSREALQKLPTLASDRTGIYVGMGVDTTIARHGLRVRLQSLFENKAALDADLWRRDNSAAAPKLTAAGVIGTMPNIPANRLHAQYDWTAPGFTISSEENSGLDALALAIGALRAGEIDAALAAAVDFSREPAHEAALNALSPLNSPGAPDLAAEPGDGAVALVAMRRSDADAQNLAYHAIVDLELVENRAKNDGQPYHQAFDNELTTRFGVAHAAHHLIALTARMLCASSGIRLDEAGAWPTLAKIQEQQIQFNKPISNGPRYQATIAPQPTNDRTYSPGATGPCVAVYASDVFSELKADVSANRHSRNGVMRLAIVAPTPKALAEKHANVLKFLERNEAPKGPGIFFHERPIDGGIAFCFTGAAAAYPGAARDLFAAFPELNGLIAKHFKGGGALGQKLFGANVKSFDPRRQLTASALVCQAHAAFTREIVGIQPTAAIGLSSGETNALLAFGVWRDLDAMLSEIDRSGLYGEELTGKCLAAAKTWGLDPDRPIDWKCWRLAAPVEAVEAALSNEPRAYMTIIHHKEDCVIGGDAAACDRVVAQVGRNKAIDLGLDMIVHCAAMEPFATSWRRIHTRKTFDPGPVQFYSNATNAAYRPTSEAAAEAVTRQALEPIDFTKTLERAYEDGIRVFIEHGPRSILTDAVGRILKNRPHLAVGLDSASRDPVLVLTEAVCALWAGGVDLALETFLSRVCRPMAPQEKELEQGPVLSLPAHPPNIDWTAARFDYPSTDHLNRTSTATDETWIELPKPNGALAYDLAASWFSTQGSQPATMPLPAKTHHNIAETSAQSLTTLVQQIGAYQRAFQTEQAATHQALLAFSSTVLAAKSTGGEARRLPKTPSPSAPKTAHEPARENVHPHQQRASRDETRPVLTRQQLETHSGGKISSVFGPLFERQDAYRRQVRMPEPPLLFADRVMVLDGEPGTMGTGRVVTETDVKEGAWYLHNGRMAPGIVIESGQADLLLVSWLGADFLNKDERVYRLLGCELTFHGELPKPGETLRYDIQIDGHAKSGDVRLFFFHYDCFIGDRHLLSVRNGQAGFFSDDELKQSSGVLWDAAQETPKVDAVLDPPPCPSRKRQFTTHDLEALRRGDAYTCFGAGFERAAPHQRTPALPAGRLNLLDEIVTFDPKGGPWGRGYLKARTRVSTDAWFYKGHFKNDPCMPGTLMADAATQALGFAMAAMGFTIERDGWRFEPTDGDTAKFVCRGQVIPDTDHILDYEVFIEEIIDGETPTVYAALLCSSDGLKVFGCRRFGLMLVPDWPLATDEASAGGRRARPLVDDVYGDWPAMIACAWGRPSQAFGALYQKFDGPRRAPRLPGPPYHFVSRIVSTDAAPGHPQKGARVVGEYDPPSDAWYFEETGGTMPFAVLLEVLLQPCGWLASLMGFAANNEKDVAFRNLDGNDATVFGPVRPGMGPIRVEAELVNFANAAGTTIVSFEVIARCGDETVMTLKTAFGFFNPAALSSQTGLPVNETQKQWLTRESEGPLPRPQMAKQSKLGMIEQISGYWPQGGDARAGRIRGTQTVDPSAWYFKAHFYQDPVQPGSLGLEALIELARHFFVAKGLADTAHSSDIQLVPGAPLSWRFRGQVTPTSKTVTSELEVLEIKSSGENGHEIVFCGNLWVDGLRIFEVPKLSLKSKPALQGGM